MMKLSAKPVSSPGRAEKYYPPPIMRFLRSNVGSRSRGRSRSSPMFIRKKNTAIETQEPTSPKVTCMGQVRVKRSKQNPKTLKPKPKHKCKWIHNTFFCHQFYVKPKPNCFTTSWPKCITFCVMGFRRKSKAREEFLRNEAKFSNRSEDIEQESKEDEDDDEEEEAAAKVYASTTPITPPKNALLLTRCRSAPYRSSSLAFKFWGSPLESEETEQKQSIETSEDESVESERDALSSQETKIEQESEEKAGFFKEFAGSLSSIRQKKAEDSKFEDGNLRPLILTRCKSEPARRGEKLDPEISFWKKRSGFLLLSDDYTSGVVRENLQGSYNFEKLSESYNGK